MLRAVPGQEGSATPGVLGLLPATAHRTLRSPSREGTRALLWVLCGHRQLQAVGASCERAGMPLSQEMSTLIFVAALPWVPLGHGISAGKVLAPPWAPVPSPSDPAGCSQSQGHIPR